MYGFVHLELDIEIKILTGLEISILFLIDDGPYSLRLKCFHINFRAIHQRYIMLMSKEVIAF